MVFMKRLSITPALIIMLPIMLFIPLFATNDMSVIAEFQGEHHYSGFGDAIESLDFNHDGYTDLVVFSRFYGYTVGVGGSRGKVYIYYGGPDFDSATTPSVTLEGTTTMVMLNIFNVGDINGDGYEDLCIYDYSPLPSHEDRRLRFYFGGSDSLDNPDHVISFSYNDEVLRVSNMGDFDGDGYDDVGLHYILRQPPYIKKFTIMWGGELVEQVVLEYSYNNAISSISGIGDLDGDGYRDFALGFTNPDPYTGYHMISINHGNPERDLSNPDVLIQTQEPITKDSRPIGDVNGDGYDDFMGYYSNAGMHAWLGGISIDYSIPSFNFTPGWSGNEASSCLKYGDLNGDGFDDVIGTTYNERKFSVWMGSIQMNGTSDLIKFRNYDNFGYGIATGDFNADGFCDVAIGAPILEYNNTPNFPGYLWIYGGNDQLQDTTVANDDPIAPQLIDQLHMRLSPNPVRTNDEITISISGVYKKRETPLKVEIFNLKGQVMHRIEVNNMLSNELVSTVNISNYFSGMYLCRARIGDQSTIKKFTIIK